MSKCVAACCSVLQYVVTCYIQLRCGKGTKLLYTLKNCTAVCCSVLQCVAVRCNVLQCAAVWQGNKFTVTECVLECVAACCSVLPYIAMCYSVLRCGKGTEMPYIVLQLVAVCCMTLQCVIVCCGIAREQRYSAEYKTIPKTCNAVPNSRFCLDKVFYRCWHCVAVCCSLLQCVAIRCNVLHCVAVLSWQGVLSLLTLCCSVFQRVASVLRGLTLCCSVLQCVTVSFKMVSWEDVVFLSRQCFVFID